MQDGLLLASTHEADGHKKRSDLDTLPNSELISRITALEAQLKTTTEQLQKALRSSASTSASASGSATTPTITTTNGDPNSLLAKPTTTTPTKPSKTPKKAPKPFDPSAYSTRHIALKFSYIGHEYNGYEHSNNSTSAPVKPTIEEVLWKALRKARLISPPLAEGADQSYEVVWDEKERAARYGVGIEGFGKGKRGKERLELVWDGVEYSKCGRTDRGVSAFGQVVGLRVRSSRPRSKSKEQATPRTLMSNLESQDSHVDGGLKQQVNGTLENHISLDSFSAVTGISVAGDQVRENHNDAVTAEDDDQVKVGSQWDSVRDELPYITILNGVLPSSIRILAWCPHPPPSFDARFSCKERRYKYFFTNPAMCPTAGDLGMTRADGSKTSIREGWLDIDAMKVAAKKLEGLHDFRNFCKIDASKQMSSCERRVTYADVEEFSGGIESFVRDARLDQAGSGADGVIQDLMKTVVGDSFGISNEPKIYAFAVHGTAFLWHQVRCMVAILFLVGQGLESPEIVDRLLDIHETPGRPHYDMADDAPLVLWDCAFPGDDPGDEHGLEWVYAGDKTSLSSAASKGDGKFGPTGLIDQLWMRWRQAKMQETLSAGLLGLVLRQGDGRTSTQSELQASFSASHRSQKVFDGSPAPRYAGEYIPVLKRPRLETLEVQNAKYAAGKQSRRDIRKAQEAISISKPEHPE